MGGGEGLGPTSKTRARGRRKGEGRVSTPNLKPNFAYGRWRVVCFCDREGNLGHVLVCFCGWEVSHGHVVVCFSGIAKAYNAAAAGRLAMGMWWCVSVE